MKEMIGKKEIRAEVTSGGKLLQRQLPATGNARSPTETVVYVALVHAECQLIMGRSEAVCVYVILTAVNRWQNVAHRQCELLSNYM